MRLLTAVGLALLGAGVVLGLIPALSSADGRCGSPFAPVSSVARPAACDGLLAVQRTGALGLALVGGGLWVAAFGLHITDPTRPTVPVAGPSTGPSGGSGQAKAGA